MPRRSTGVSKPPTEPEHKDGATDSSMPLEPPHDDTTAGQHSRDDVGSPEREDLVPTLEDSDRTAVLQARELISQVEITSSSPVQDTIDQSPPWQHESRRISDFDRFYDHQSAEEKHDTARTDDVFSISDRLLRTAQVNLAKVYLAMAALLERPDWSNDELISLSEKQAALKRTISSLSPDDSTITGKPHDATAQATPKPDPDVSHSRKEIKTFARQMPKYIKGLNPKLFIRKLTTQLLVYNVDKRNWVHYLCAAMPPVFQDWCAQNLLLIQNWDDAVETWKNHFSRTSDITAARVLYDRISEGNDLLTFTQEFETWWCSAFPEGDINGPSARSEFLMKMNQQSLYIGPLRQQVRLEPPDTYEELKTAALEMQDSYCPTPQNYKGNNNGRNNPSAYATQRNNNRHNGDRTKNKTCVHHPNSTTHTTAECSKSSPGQQHKRYNNRDKVNSTRAIGAVSTQNTGTKRCEHHPHSTTHSTAECSVTQQKAGSSSTSSYSNKNNKSNSPQKKATQQKNVICHTCREPGHFSSACPNSHRPVFRMTSELTCMDTDTLTTQVDTKVEQPAGRYKEKVHGPFGFMPDNPFDMLNKEHYRPNWGDYPADFDCWPQDETEDQTEVDTDAKDSHRHESMLEDSEAQRFSLQDDETLSHHQDVSPTLSNVASLKNPKRHIDVAKTSFVTQPFFTQQLFNMSAQSTTSTDSLIASVQSNPSRTHGAALQLGRLYNDGEIPSPDAKSVLTFCTASDEYPDSDDSRYIPPVPLASESGRGTPFVDPDQPPPTPYDDDLPIMVPLPPSFHSIASNDVIIDIRPSSPESSDSVQFSGFRNFTASRTAVRSRSLGPARSPARRLPKRPRFLSPLPAVPALSVRAVSRQQLVADEANEAPNDGDDESEEPPSAISFFSTKKEDNENSSLYFSVDSDTQTHTNTPERSNTPQPMVTSTIERTVRAHLLGNRQEYKTALAETRFKTKMLYL